MIYLESKVLSTKFQWCERLRVGNVEMNSLELNVLIVVKHDPVDVKWAML